LQYSVVYFKIEVIVIEDNKASLVARSMYSVIQPELPKSG